MGLELPLGTIQSLPVIGLDLGSHAFATKENTSLPAINTYNLLYSLLFAYKFYNGYILKEDAAFFAPHIFAKLQGSWQ